MDPFDPALFDVGTECRPCCAPVTECGCYLPIPYSPGVVLDPYPDLATAQFHLADVAGCSVWNQNSFAETPTTFTADLSVPNSLGIHFVQPGAVSVSFPFTLFTSITVAACTLTIPFTVTLNIGPFDSFVVRAFLYNCATGAEVNFDDQGIGGNAGSGTLTLAGVAAGTYVLGFNMTAFAAGPTVDVNVTFTVNCDTAMVVNPVVALWDDAGTTRQFEACPKLIVPIDAVTTGDWFVDCATALNYMATYSLNCLSNWDINPPTDLNSWSMVVGASTVDLTAQFTGNFGEQAVRIMLSISVLTSGTSLTVNYAVSTGALHGGDIAFGVFILNGPSIPPPGGYSADWAPVANPPPISGVFPSLTPLVPGNYEVQIYFQGGSGAEPGSFVTDGSATLTFSNPVTVNPVQALYNVGLDCPARLNCGDACP